MCFETKIFGEKNNIAIEYAFESDIVDDTYGFLKLWINNKNICAYDENQQYTGDLYYIADWFCDKIKYILEYDTFPLPVDGETALELVEKANDFYSDSELEFDLWYEAKSRWILNHCWLVARGGAILPCVYFRRIGDLMEISWNNTFWKKETINFDFQKGTFRIEFNIFADVFIKFLKSMIYDIKMKVSSIAKVKELEKYISILNSHVL